jgi:hypothetical protein
MLAARGLAVWRSAGRAGYCTAKVTEVEEKRTFQVDPKVKEDLQRLCVEQLPTVLFSGRYWPTSLLQSLPQPTYVPSKASQ